MTEVSKIAASTLSRRTLVKGAVATAGGAAAAGYVKPSMTALGVMAAHARVSAPPPPPNDTTPPICTWRFRQWAPGQPTYAGFPTAYRGHKYVEVTVHDPESGLSNIIWNTALNVYLHGHTFTPGTTAPVTFTATKINNSTRSQLDITVVNMVGLRTHCDPIFDELMAGGTEVYSGVPDNEWAVTILNGSPGLSGVDISVNGNPLTPAPRNMADGGVYHLSAQQFMVPGPNNTFVVTPIGAAGGTADIIIANIFCDCS